jgi:hypothetical protein
MGINERGSKSGRGLKCCDFEELICSSESHAKKKHGIEI